MIIKFGILQELFFRKYQGTSPLLIKKAVTPDLIQWGDVNEILARHDVTSENFKLMRGYVIPKAEYMESYLEVATVKYRVIKPILYDLMREGASLVLNKIEGAPKIDAIRKEIAQFAGRQTVVSGYAAFGTEVSFGNHWDTHDVFAVQLIGRKRWTIYKPTLEYPLYTHSSVGREHDCGGEPFMDVVLEAGDVFYLPRGWWHTVSPTGGETFHLAIGTYPAYTVDYLQWLCTHVMPETVETRKALHDWKQDQNTFVTIAGQLTKELQNPENYQRFMQVFSAAQRSESRYTIEIFGNKNADPKIIPDTIGIRLNNNKNHDLTQDIINGVKVKLDESSFEIIKIIAMYPEITISELLNRSPELSHEKLRALVYDLCHQDILELAHFE